VIALAERARDIAIAPWLVVAALVHVAVAAIHPAARGRAPSTEPMLEVDLAVAPAIPEAPARAPEEAAPDAVKDESVVEKPRTPAPARKAAAPKAAPEAARAGAVLASGEASAPGDPVSFVTDPNGASYGIGVVARGGTADRGDGARAAPPPATTGAAADAVTPASQLLRAPKLEEADPCRGFFPARATADVGTVTLSLVVRSSGAVSEASVIDESPRGDGFGAAGRACLRAKRFSPGLGPDGSPTTSATTVRIHFHR
jgi:outer membrane biosynthesis protein TonB